VGEKQPRIRPTAMTFPGAAATWFTKRDRDQKLKDKKKKTGKMSAKRKKLTLKKELGGFSPHSLRALGEE